MPQCSLCRGSGIRSVSVCAKSNSAMIRVSLTGLATRMPSPRASIIPETAGIADPQRTRPRAPNATRSSATSEQPIAIISRARLDFPDPDGPEMSSPRPSRSTRLACTISGGSDRSAIDRHTGSPTTKRAPRGSDVKSASVGRIFSAQMTPPWASTICFDIASPSPELLPN